MAKINEIDITSLLWQEGSAPSTPASTKWRQYFKTDGLYIKDDAGTETGPMAPASAVSFVGVRAVANAATSITTATWTALAFAGTDRFDTHAFHNPASNNTRLTVPSGQDGTYLIGGNGEFESNSTGQRACRIFLNGATRIGGEHMQDAAAGTQPTRLELVTLYALSATDYVELQLWQNSGSTLNSQQAANSTGEFWMYKVG